LSFLVIKGAEEIRGDLPGAEARFQKAAKSRIPASAGVRVPENKDL